ncbi:HpaII family restriction endonuclease [Neisseria sp. SLRRB23]
MLLSDKTEASSSERHGFGKIYEDDGGYFIKLNL